MTCIPLLCTPGVLQERFKYRPAIPRAGRPSAHGFTCYRMNPPVMAATWQQSGVNLPQSKLLQIYRPMKD